MWIKHCLMPMRILATAGIMYTIDVCDYIHAFVTTRVKAATRGMPSNVYKRCLGVRRLYLGVADGVLTGL